MVHWIDATAQKILNKYINKDILHFSGGLSVRGIQHIGRLRGELFIGGAIKEILETQGKKVIQYLVIYDRDPIPEKALKKVFKDESQVRLLSYKRLEDLPDPYECCNSWVEHFWKEFGNYLHEFKCEPTIVRTSELYRSSSMQNVVKEIISKREKVREISNKYRGENPHPEGWIPFVPICNNCGKIRFVEAKDVDLEDGKILYECKNCNTIGESKLTEGKLEWRLEWPALWKALDIEFEPYGKDHAAAGGSRESSSLIAKEVLNIEPPFGFPYEWVSLKIYGKDLGEMTASGFVGITPKEWLSIAEPEVLRFFYLFAKPMSHLQVDIDNLPLMVDRFDRAERVYYGLEGIKGEDKSYYKRTYELAVKKPSAKPPLRIPYSHASLVSQIVGISGKYSEAIRRLKKTGHIPLDATDENLCCVYNRLAKAYTWTMKYAPERYKIRISDEIEEIRSKLSPVQKEFLASLAKYLESSVEVKGLDVHNTVYSIAQDKKVKASILFEAGYIALFNRNFGPRFGELIATLDKEFVVKRFKEVSS